jgi:hypothetical protein
MADPAETLPEPIEVVIIDETGAARVDPLTGTIETPRGDGGVVVQLDAHRPREEAEGENQFYLNLADEVGQLRLSQIANELYDAISADDRSRQGYLEIRKRGFDLLGTKLEEPKSTVGDSSAVSDGVSSVTNPLLLEAVLRGWANAQAELLPADGPVKIKETGAETDQQDDLAEAFERDFNYYLTKIATEYYPDTSHMLLWGVYFGGSGFKKIYRCPMRRRIVSDSVDATDLIVSDTTKDLRSCARITHQIMMRPSVMKRMKFLGAYRSVMLTQPTPVTTPAERAVAGVQGTAAQPERPEDQPYTVWESQCELDLDAFAPKKFRGEGIPLPYLVTMDKDSREILALRRDWNEDDEEAERKRRFVRYPYVPGPGFYGTGLLNILGNATAAMTAAWREALDAGMYASFPGGLIDKAATRQNTSDFRVAPGQFDALDLGQRKIADVVMPLPYRDVTPGLMSMIDKVVQQAGALSGTADIPTAEGIQNVPVGTMLAQIEQATKIIAAAHKGMHHAQAEEIEMMLDAFREYPEDFWRLNRQCAGFWNETNFFQALDNCNLIPVSDPNVPSHLHRVMKGIALLQLGASPVTGPYLSGKTIADRCLKALKEDPNGLLIDPAPQAQGPDPNMLKAQAQLTSAQANMQRAQAASGDAQMKQQLEPAKLLLEREIADKDLTREMIIHQADQAKMMRADRLSAGNQAFDQLHKLREQGLGAMQQNFERAQQAREHGLNVAQHLHERDMAQRQQALDQRQQEIDREVALKPPSPKPKST